MAEVPTKAQAAKAAKQEQLSGEIRCRQLQLECTETAISKLRQEQQVTRAKGPELDQFVSHLAGFYDEIDKLAKGKSLVEATDMIVEGANSIVRDAKALIDGDVYIDRLKEFVPAGENPVYPDVLMVARIIQQATARFRETLQSRGNKIFTLLREAETIKCALEIFIDDGDPGYVASKEDVEGHIGKPTESWFEFAEDEEGPFFDFERLDGLDIGKYLTTILAASNAQE
jgi:hypothetical protein